MYMKSCKLIIKDEVNIKFEGLPLEARRKLANTFKYVLPYARFQPAYKLGRWDGTTSLFGIGGSGYLTHIEKILGVLDSMDIEVTDIEDHRSSKQISFTPVTETYWADQGKVWPKGHQQEGQPILLRDYQVDAINNFLQYHQSLQEIATGAGKTITTATLSQLCEPYGRTITIVPNKSLVEQTEEDFRNVGLDVGVYYGDRKELNCTHTICTWQSLNILDKKSKNGETDQLTLAEFLDGVTAVIVDEVHMAKAEVLKNLLTRNLNNACIRWGLTGTVPKEPYEHEQIFASIGPLVGGIKASELQERGVLSNCHVNIVQLVDLPEFKNYADELKYLVTDETRMIYISKFIKNVAEKGNTLVLVNRIDTGKFIVNELEGSVFISGNVKTKDRKEEYDEVATSQNKVIVATYGVAAVGINIPRIFNLVLIESGKSFVRVIQSIGRGIRRAEDKDHVEIWDVTSTCKFSKRHLTERKKYYKEAQYPFSIQKMDWQ
ncbi:MAG: DEAD/DEAH box helicase [Verrucomicrobia bacterium]|nr:DEAD/DEAH box helicase [Verrucomicrobiota bacterium]